MEKSPTQAVVQFHKGSVSGMGVKILQVEPACPLDVSGGGGGGGLRSPLSVPDAHSNIIPQKSTQSFSRTYSRSQWAFPPQKKPESIPKYTHGLDSTTMAGY